MKKKRETIKHPHTDIASITYIPDKKSESKYEIRVRKKYSSTGKAKRYYKKTQAEAKEFINLLANEKKDFGSHALKQFPPEKGWMQRRPLKS